jgi:hypothetical protein
MVRCQRRSRLASKMGNLIRRISCLCIRCNFGCSSERGRGEFDVREGFRGSRMRRKVCSTLVCRVPISLSVGTQTRRSWFRMPISFGRRTTLSSGTRFHTRGPIPPVNRSHRGSLDMRGVANALALSQDLRRHYKSRTFNGTPPRETSEAPATKKTPEKRRIVPSVTFLPRNPNL